MGSQPRIDFAIRRARADEAVKLTQLAFAAKRFWGYSEAAIALWRDTLTVLPQHVKRHPTFIAEHDGNVLGFSMLWSDRRRFELEHLWVDPAYMRQGIGQALLRAITEEMLSLGGTTLSIDADPNAEGFYLACGARRVGEVPGPTPENPTRMRPLLELRVAL